MSQWKINSKKTVFKAELFDVKEVNLKSAVGKIKIHHEIDRAPVVSVFPLTDSYEIYLISQYRYMLEKTVLEAVSGYMNKGETTIAAARRELKEETGIEALQFEEIARIQIGASVFKSAVNLFLAKGLEMGDNDPDEDEEIKLVKMPLSEAVEKVMNGEINHATSMIGLLMLDKLRKEKKL
jgi:ADP-ribose pyrophosphatase